jgi:hypothetical protein
VKGWPTASTATQTHAGRGEQIGDEGAVKPPRMRRRSEMSASARLMAQHRRWGEERGPACGVLWPSGGSSGSSSQGARHTGWAPARWHACAMQSSILVASHSPRVAGAATRRAGKVLAGIAAPPADAAAVMYGRRSAGRRCNVRLHLHRRLGRRGDF